MPAIGADTFEFFSTSLPPATRCGFRLLRLDVPDFLLRVAVLQLLLQQMYV